MDFPLLSSPFPAQTSGFLRPPAQQASLPQWWPGLHLSLLRETAHYCTVGRQPSPLWGWLHGLKSFPWRSDTDVVQCGHFNGAGLSVFGYRSHNMFKKIFLLLSPMHLLVAFYPLILVLLLRLPSDSGGQRAHLVFLSQALTSLLFWGLQDFS